MIWEWVRYSIGTFWWGGKRRNLHQFSLLEPLEAVLTFAVEICSGQYKPPFPQHQDGIYGQSLIRLAFFFLFSRDPLTEFMVVTQSCFLGTVYLWVLGNEPSTCTLSCNLCLLLCEPQETDSCHFLHFPLTSTGGRQDPKLDEASC